MQKITPFLWFDGKAEEAAQFYIGIFPDARVVGGMPGPDGKPMVVSFELAGQQFVAINGGPMYQFTEAVSFVVNCKDQAEIDHYWNALTANGGAPGRCGWLKDRFGLSWQVVPEQMPSLIKSPAALQAMMGMSKLVIGELEAAG